MGSALRRDLAARDVEVESLRKELDELRRTTQRQLVPEPIWGKGIGDFSDDAPSVALHKLALASAAGGTLPAAIAGTFEDAIGILDLVQTQLTASNSVRIL